MGLWATWYMLHYCLMQNATDIHAWRNKTISKAIYLFLLLLLLLLLLLSSVYLSCRRMPHMGHMGHMMPGMPPRMGGGGPPSSHPNTSSMANNRPSKPIFPSAGQVSSRSLVCVIFTVRMRSNFFHRLIKRIFAYLIDSCQIYWTHWRDF